MTAGINVDLMREDRLTPKSTLNSMTGFARAEGSVEECAWVWEVKSVNAKGFDVRCRISGFDGIEQAVRERVHKRFQRGSLSVNLQVSWERQTTSFKINSEALDRVSEIIPKLQACFPDSQPLSLDGLFAVKGVVETSNDPLDENCRTSVENMLLDSFEALLERLAETRAEEGARLTEVIARQLHVISDLCQQAENVTAAQPEAIKNRLANQVRELMDQVPVLSEERLAQEAAMLMLKADVREELDRLASHCEAARALLSEDKAVGRRFDFLCQEFNREANTLCSKSTDIVLTRIGLELKATIEQMREQIQNVE